MQNHTALQPPVNDALFIITLVVGCLLYLAVAAVFSCAVDRLEEENNRKIDARIKLHDKRTCITPNNPKQVWVPTKVSM